MYIYIYIYMYTHLAGCTAGLWLDAQLTREETG